MIPRYTPQYATHITPDIPANHLLQPIRVRVFDTPMPHLHMLQSAKNNIQPPLVADIPPIDVARLRGICPGPDFLYHLPRPHDIVHALPSLSAAECSQRESPVILRDGFTRGYEQWPEKSGHGPVVALSGKIDDIGAGEEGEVGMFLHDGVIARGEVDGAI